MLCSPEILRDVHAEYIETGANLVISNTSPPTWVCCAMPEPRPTSMR